MTLPRQTLALLFLLTITTVAGSSLAQTRPSAESFWAQPHVFLITIGPGDEPYEQFGHDALWIYDPPSNTDLTYDYGRFDFDQPNFIGRFIKGRMLYSMGVDDPNDMVTRYGSFADRDVWLQELNLSPDQQAKLRTFLATNMLPAKRDYRYDYYTANCATKVRDALDAVLDGQIRRQLASRPTDMTYRRHTRIQMAPFRIYTAGLDLAMAQPTDLKLSAWEDAFLPQRLQEHLRAVTVLDAAGHAAPLVLSERQIYKSKTRPPDRPEPRWGVWFLLIGIAIGAFMMLLTRFRWRRTFVVVAVAWCLAASLAAAFMIGLRVFTDHERGYGNENLFLFEPLSVALIVMIPLMLIRRKALNATPMLAVAVLSIAVLGIAVKPLPWFFQDNGWMIALALPVHAALAYALLVWRGRLPVASMLGTQDALAGTAGTPGHGAGR